MMVIIHEHVLLFWQYFLHDTWEIFYFWEGIKYIAHG